MITIVVSRSRFTRQWRWTAKAANNRVLATSGKESYYNLTDLMDTITTLFSRNVGVQVLNRQTDDPAVRIR